MCERNRDELVAFQVQFPTMVYLHAIPLNLRVRHTAVHITSERVSFTCKLLNRKTMNKLRDRTGDIHDRVLLPC